MDKAGKLFFSFAAPHIIKMFFMVHSARSGAYDGAEDIIDQSRDGKFMASGKKSIISVPIPISNPRPGTGLLAALIYMHPEDDSGPESPNATSRLAAIYKVTPRTPGIYLKAGRLSAGEPASGGR
jgi:hypothetical protein